MCAMPPRNEFTIRQREESTPMKYSGMSETIQPTLTIQSALTDEEWERRVIDRIHGTDHSGPYAYSRFVKGDPASPSLAVDSADWTPDALPALIALANATLPDSDPRKITRRHTSLLRVAVGAMWSGKDRNNRPAAVALDRLADTLESYLPPEEN
jgi:hypothetical protein